jgi:tRNA-splicing ligase RtcB
MPDIHWGYGFPIGGVAAIDAVEGVISPGGVGYDINCGVRLARTNLRFADIASRADVIANALFDAIPAGIGSEGAVAGLEIADLKRIVAQGVNWALRNGYASAHDIEHTEENGCLSSANPEMISAVAYQRGRKQLGTLGSGNHFLEISHVDEIYDSGAAAAMGIEPGQITLMIHSGSRGLGHQTCDDYLKVIGGAMAGYGINLPDRQLAAVPIISKEGQAYLGAMAAAANFAWCNRQVMMHHAREALMRALGVGPNELGLSLVYDVCHNIAKFEDHVFEGRKRNVCVHRKGATRAFGPHNPELPAAFRSMGQPVLIPGDMGRYSFILVGCEAAMRETFGSSCHGAGRTMSRTRAKQTTRGRDLFGELRAAGVSVRARSRAGVAEEMPLAYKDVAEVVDVMEAVGVTRRVARLKPFVVIKG